MSEADEISYRRCGLEDAWALSLIAAATFLENFAGLVPGQSMLDYCRKNGTEKFGTFLRHECTRAWIATVEPGEAPVGYAMITIPDFPEGLAQPGDLELRKIYLFSRFHGSGRGQRLMDLAIAGAREQKAARLLLGVHPDNHRALGFYGRNGFRQIGTRQFQVGASVFEDPVLARTL